MDAILTDFVEKFVTFGESGSATPFLQSKSVFGFSAFCLLLPFFWFCFPFFFLVMGQAFSCVSSGFFFSFQNTPPEGSFFSFSYLFISLLNLSDKKNRKSSHSKEKPRRKEGLKKEGSNELDFHSLEELFQVYAGGEDVIGVDGIIQFCSDIGVALEDPMMLLISYFMGAKEQGQYTKEEFVGGFSKLQVDSINKIQNKIPEWRAMLDPRHPNFKDIFKVSFSLLSFFFWASIVSF